MTCVRLESVGELQSQPWFLSSAKGSHILPGLKTADVQTAFHFIGSETQTSACDWCKAAFNLALVSRYIFNSDAKVEIGS